LHSTYFGASQQNLLHRTKPQAAEIAIFLPTAAIWAVQRPSRAARFFGRNLKWEDLDFFELRLVRKILNWRMTRKSLERFSEKITRRQKAKTR
jgi:hypothetical protein